MTRPLLIALLLAPLAACVTVSETGPNFRGHRPPPREPSAAATAFSVSPLTRVGFDPSGNPTLFLHLDFRDAANANTKAYGVVRAELYRPGVVPPAGTPATPQPVDTSWDVNLVDPVQNALMYDEMITRTYALKLTGIPEWLMHWSRHEDDPATPASAAGNAPTLVVQFAAPNSDKPLRTTYTLTR